MEEYKKLVSGLLKSGEDIIHAMSPEDANLWHLATGVAGEGGELLDAVKRKAVYQKPLDIENVIEELGDLEFYMEGLRAALGITREQVLKANMNKLNKRYHTGKYSDAQAQDRADKKVPNTV
mgnify:CR=1 FL=1